MPDRYTLVNVPGGLLAIDLGFQGSSCHSSCLFVLVTSSIMHFPVFLTSALQKTRGSQTLTCPQDRIMQWSQRARRPRNVVKFGRFTAGSSTFSVESKGQLGVSKNNGTPKSSILIGFSLINHPFWVPLFLETPG